MNEQDRLPRANPPGVFISKGTRVTILAGGLSIGFDEQGNLTSSCTLHISIDLCPHWLLIAFTHVCAAEEAHAALLEANKADDAEAISSCLEREFVSGMQAMTAAAIAIDAFYAAVREHAPVPNDVIGTWQKNKTSRPKQISEVFRRAFPMLRRGNNNLKGIIKEIFRFRDLAVHPKSVASEAVYYPAIDKNVEWRYQAFSFSNAVMVVRLALQTVVVLTRDTNPYDNNQLKEYCSILNSKISDLITQWERRYSKLIEDKK